MPQPMTDPINETGRVSITAGIANAMVSYGGARQCPECNFVVPKYPGRYPRGCPRCGEEMVGCKTESIEEANVLLLHEKEATKAWLKTLLGKAYTAFIGRLKGSAHDPKVIAAIKSGLDDGDREDDAVAISATSPKVSSLRPSQNEVDISKSLKWPLTDETTARKCLKGVNVEIQGPIVTFRSKFVVDGHHRWSQIYATNSKATVKSENLMLKGKHSSSDVLKAVQMSIAAVTGAVPSSTVSGTNLLTASETQIKAYVVKTLKDSLIPIYAEYGAGTTREEIADYIWGNVKVMQKKSQPPKDAPSRGNMPQTDQAPGWDKALKRGEINHNAPFIESALDEGLLERAAARLLKAMRKRAVSLGKVAAGMRVLSKQITAVAKPPNSGPMRMAVSLERDAPQAVKAAAREANESWEPTPLPQVDESVIGTIIAIPGSFLTLIGTVIFLLKSLSWLFGKMGFKALSALCKRGQLALEEVEETTIDWLIPAEVSYRIYRLLWKTGWRVTAVVPKTVAGSGANRKREHAAPFTFEEYLNRKEWQRIVEVNAFKFVAYAAALTGVVQILRAPMANMLAYAATHRTAVGLSLGQMADDTSDVVTRGSQIAKAFGESIDEAQVEAPFADYQRAQGWGFAPRNVSNAAFDMGRDARRAAGAAAGQREADAAYDKHGGGDDPDISDAFYDGWNSEDFNAQHRNESADESFYGPSRMQIQRFYDGILKTSGNRFHARRETERQFQLKYLDVRDDGTVVGFDMNESIPVVCGSRAARIQALIEGGSQSFSPLAPACSSVVTVRYAKLIEAHGSVDTFRTFLEGPTNGHHFRIEEGSDPVLIFEFNDSTQRMRVFATEAPARYLDFDPRADVVAEDHAITFEDFEGANPDNVRMIDLGETHDIISPKNATELQVFVTEADASMTATELGLALTPSSRSIGGNPMWVLVHEDTGFVLACGEATRLLSETGYNAVTYGPERVRTYNRALDRGHDRVAGAFAEDKRASRHRPRKPGERSVVRGGMRISTNTDGPDKPRKDISQSLQNKVNANAPGALRKRIKGLKKFHRTTAGKQQQRTLGRHQRLSGESHDAALRGKVTDVMDRIARYSAGGTRQIVHEDMGILGNEAAGGGANTDQGSALGPQSIRDKTAGDYLEAIIRRLIVTTNVDVLQDVEFDDETGSIYLFFDPVLYSDEVQEILSAIMQEVSSIQLIASPDLSLPGEAVESDWWVMYMPGPGEVASPDATYYAARPEDYATKMQAVVMTPSNEPEALAQGIDVSAMLKAAGN